MKNTTLLLIGVAAIGVGYYIWKKKGEKKESFVSSDKIGLLSKNGL